MSDHHVRWSSFEWWTSLCWSYLLYDSRSIFRSQCSEAISAYARLVKFNPEYSACAKTGLHPLYVNVELITPDHHVVSRHDELSQRCILRENTYTLKFSERSSYNATAVLSKIRCIKEKTSHAINISDMIWPSSSCACDLHLRSTVMITIVTSATPWSPL